MLVSIISPSEGNVDVSGLLEELMLAWPPQWFDLLEILFPWKPIKTLWLLRFLHFLDSCGSCCLGGRLIFFQCDVVHSSHLWLVWGGVRGCVGVKLLYIKRKQRNFWVLLPALPLCKLWRFSTWLHIPTVGTLFSNILYADFLPRVKQAH